MSIVAQKCGIGACLIPHPTEERLTMTTLPFFQPHLTTPIDSVSTVGRSKRARPVVVEPEPTGARLAPVTPHTVQELIDAYEREVLPHKAPNTQYQKRKLHLWFARDLGDLPLEQLTPALLRTWRDQLAARYSPGTVKRYCDNLSALLTFAVELEWLPVNPILKVRRPKQPEGRTRILSDEERTRLFRACLESRNRHLFPIVLIALSTGMRKGEILALRWRNVDVERGQLSIEHSKNKERRAVPVTGQALQLLRERAPGQDPNALLFPGEHSGKPVLFQPAWRAALRRAEIDGATFHDLRHCCASALAMNGASLLDIATVLGHKSLQMTKRYSHLTTSHQAGIMEKMTSTLEVIPSAPRGTQARTHRGVFTITRPEGR
jgi:integrase